MHSRCDRALCHIWIGLGRYRATNPCETDVREGFGNVAKSQMLVEGLRVCVQLREQVDNACSVACGQRKQGPLGTSKCAFLGDMLRSRLMTRVCMFFSGFIIVSGRVVYAVLGNQGRWSIICGTMS